MSEKTGTTPTGCRGLFTLFSIVSAAVIAAVLILFFAPVVLRAAGALLVTADPLEKSNAGLILSGGDDTRIDEAARLYEEGFIEFVILTETGVDVPEWGTDYTSLMRYAVMKEGIPESAILISEHTVESTFDEARSILKFARQRGFHSLIVITDPYHTLRTRLIFREVFAGETQVSFQIQPVRNHWYRSNTWWKSFRGWKFTLQEYVRLIGFMLGFK